MARYAQEEREKIVKRSYEIGVAQAAEEFEVSPGTISAWRQTVGNAKQAAKSSRENQAAIERLRYEIAVKKGAIQDLEQIIKALGG